MDIALISYRACYWVVYVVGVKKLYVFKIRILCNMYIDFTFCPKMISVNDICMGVAWGELNHYI